MQIKLPVSEQMILQVLCYSDIFDYPLTREEIQKYQISSCHPERSSPYDRTRDSSLSLRMTKSMSSLLKKNVILYKDGFYCLKGREKIIQLRKNRETISAGKMQKAKKIARLISFVPTVQLVGVSGSLAMNNAKENDDIDFFIITQEHTLWITRIVLIMLLHIIGVRRKRKLKKVSNKICLNTFLDDWNLLLPKNKKNLFTAHEILQMKTIFSRNNMYNKFIHSNEWIKEFLPNVEISLLTKEQERKRNFISPLEHIAKRIQLFFINRHKTTEFISDTFLAFHPNDKTPVVLKSYKSKLKNYGI